MAEIAQPKGEADLPREITTTPILSPPAEKDLLWQAASAFVFGQSLRAGVRRRRAAVPNDNQLALF